jgi:UDP-N-acetylglucosamine 2-epimerase (non-hydrolysing)
MILFCFGTRPEWIKIKPVISKLNKDEYKILFTGQHTDLVREVEVDYKIQIKEGKNRLDQVISDCLTQFPWGDFDSVLVQGDTASAFACALAAFNRGLRIVYLEAGLRSYDLKHPYPEEAYRQMISRISDVNLCPTDLSKNNLLQEMVSGQIHVVGNTVLDNLVHLKPECSYGNTVLVTLHRRENLDIMERWFREIEQLAAENPDLRFLFPIHPNPGVQKHRHILKSVEVCEPMSHEDLLKVLCKCKLAISDSGGIQEEASFFNKKVIVCRETTERPEGIYSGHLKLCKDPNDLKEMFYEMKRDHYIDVKCPYGDGQSATKVLNAIRNEGF